MSIVCDIPYLDIIQPFGDLPGEDRKKIFADDYNKCFVDMLFGIVLVLYDLQFHLLRIGIQKKPDIILLLGSHQVLGG